MIILHNADCMKVFKSINDESIDLIVTDPPYRVGTNGCAGSTGGMLARIHSNDGKVFNHNDIDCTEYAPEFYRVLKDGSHLYVMTNHVNLIHMLNTFTNCGFHFIKSLIWDKGNKIMGRFYMSQFEYILFFRKGKGVKINNCGTSDILSVPNIKSKKPDGTNYHDTEKPVELMRILIENSSQPNDLVMDPFAGIGSTLIAAKSSGRRAIGCELDPEFYNTAMDRLKEMENALW